MAEKNCIGERAWLIALVISLIPLIFIRYIFWEYAISIVTFLVIFTAMCLFFGKRVKIRKDNIIYKYIAMIILSFMFLIYLNTDLYLRKGILYGNYFLPHISIIGCLIAGAIGLSLSYIAEKRQLKYIRICVVVLGISVITWISKIWYTEYIAVYDLHYDAYFYPVYRIAEGDTCYVDFNNIYGGYGYLLAPFLKGMGIELVKRFSIIMCALVFVTFGAVFYILYKICCNKIVSVIGLFACMYYPAIFMIKQQGNAYYLQYVPHRMLFPCIIGSLIIKWIDIKENARKRVWFTVINLTGIVSVVWNVETGVVCVIGIMLFFFMWRMMIEKNAGASFCTILIVVGDILGAYIFVNFITYVRTTKFVTLQTFLFGTRMFADGFLSYKADFKETNISVWLIMILTECMLAAAIWRFLKKQESENIRNKCIVIIYFCIMLFGLLLYGLLKSSHPYNVTPVLYYGIIIAVIEIDFITSGGYKISGIILLSILAGACLGNINKTDEVCYTGVEIYLPETLGYITENTDENEHLELMMINSSYIYCMMEKGDKNDCPSCVDWFEKGGQVEEILKYLDKSNDTVVIDSYARSLIYAYNDGNYAVEFEKIMANRFEKPVVSPNGNLEIYKRKGRYTKINN